MEEQPRKLESVIHVSHTCIPGAADNQSKESYAEQAQDLVFNENILLQTLGFDVAVDHPHTHVVKTCHLVKGMVPQSSKPAETNIPRKNVLIDLFLHSAACKDLAQTSYFLASNSLHLTTMCLKYRPTVVACFCIYLACKWSRWEVRRIHKSTFISLRSLCATLLIQLLCDSFYRFHSQPKERIGFTMSINMCRWNC